MRKRAGASLSMLLLSAAVFLSATDGRAQEKGQEKEKEKPVNITEEILVVAPAPKDQPISSVTTLTATSIERLKPRDLSEVFRQVPGAMVTFGDKDTFTLKLRGMDAKRIALLVDGIPVYEPYYSSFDLKTVAASGLESIQVTKGPSSVLYGPNTLGGIVNVITRRPGPDPFLNLNLSLAEKKTYNLGVDGGLAWDHFSLAGNASYQSSDGFYYPAPETGKTLRSNSDYERLNLNAKLYYNPSDKTEIMINGGLYTSDYGMPPAMGGIQRARYWRFPDWDRYTLNAGGYTSLSDKATLRFRAFYVNYRNTLMQWRDAAMTILNFESRFDNSVYGFFTLGEFSLSDRDDLKVSLNYEKDVARQQDDVGEPWYKYDQGTFSAAAENQFALADNWWLITGLSLDYLDKFDGKNRTSLNPLIGFKYTPDETMDFHVSFAGKSRFPSMRSLYSSSSGNPDLLSERGTSYEAGFTINKGVHISGSAFMSDFKNMVDTIVLNDGTKLYYNIGRAYINGLELQVGKAFGQVETSVSYTFLSHKNKTDDRPLDALPKHTLSLNAAVRPAKGLLLDVYGIFGSKSFWYNSSDELIYDIPSYFCLDAVLSYDLGFMEAFIKASNVFDDYIYTEPIFPWRARLFEIGAKIKIGNSGK